MFNFLKQASCPEVTISEVVKVRGDGQAQLVDVRERAEWDDAHMPGSVHIPLGDLAFRKGELDPEKPVVVICRSGNRSLTGGRVLLDAGFKDVTSMSGGLVAWHQAGQPLE